MNVQIEMAPRHANDRRAASRKDANILARETGGALIMLAAVLAGVTAMAVLKAWGVW